MYHGHELGRFEPAGYNKYRVYLILKISILKSIKSRRVMYCIKYCFLPKARIVSFKVSSSQVERGLPHPRRSLGCNVPTLAVQGSLGCNVSPTTTMATTPIYILRSLLLVERTPDV
jgi:hypothetical protein